MKKCNIYLVLKTIQNESYDNLQSLPVLPIARKIY